MPGVDMNQTPLLECESPAFAVIPGKDEETNPGIYAKALAQWLAGQLRAAGFSPGEVIAEDFGWCVPVESEPHSLYVACASTGAKPDQWRVFAFTEGGVMAALFTAALRHCLESAPIVRGLREEA